MTDPPGSIDGISNVHTTDEQRFGISYQHLVFDVTVSGADGVYYELRCYLGGSSSPRATRDNLRTTDGSLTQRVSVSFGHFVDWSPGEPVRLELLAVDNNNKDATRRTVSDDVTDEIAAALTDGDERSLQAQVDALRERVGLLEQFHDGASR